MVAHFRKYKAFILAGMLVAYLAGTFQGLFLESLHQLAHIAEAVRTEFQHSYFNHVHEDGKAHTHRHVVLEVVDDALNKSESDLPVEDQQQKFKKKNPEHRSQIDPIAQSFLNLSAKPPTEVGALSDLFPKVPSPPPKRHAISLHIT